MFLKSYPCTNKKTYIWVQKALASSISTDLRYQDFTIIYDILKATLSYNWENILLRTLRTTMRMKDLALNTRVFCKTGDVKKPMNSMKNKKYFS